MIELKGVSKTYRNAGKPAVDNLTLQVRPGEIYGFLGPNGAGKTTTIKMMIGLLTPDAGSVTVAGLDLRQDPLAVKARLGFVPDSPVLYQRMSGRRFLSFIADAFSVPATERGGMDTLAGEFGLSEVLDAPLSSYSHGMKQKVSIVAALLHRPEVYILDEPIQGLDPHAAFVLKEKLKKLCEEGKTVFFSTHIMEVAERLCHRVGIINHGHLIAEGPLSDLRIAAGTDDSTLEKLFLELTDDMAATH
ncbi:MAG: ABC transporter ATP-binding protein [Spirochaetales bacterium]|nr:ABC transporter ATP-binding protein [Spirochaetales bacterium]